MTTTTRSQPTPRTQSMRTRSTSSNQQSRVSGLADTAKEHPIATAAAVGGAVAAGAFLWSRRNQVSDQVSSMSSQVGDWSKKMRGQRESNSPDMSGRSAVPMGVETGSQSQIAGAGTSASSPTSGTGQSTNPARGGSTAPSM